ncbi:EamA family transporter [Psychromonas sp. psych-6C06]|uniref:DMT family transporter n=1 Tax=Psychromonas sp. psych-6C06 TaxID=2058089 RepID=UPI000C3344B4|nr:DMT family transporter [Psychromonas sp. psych-6C06]PKF60992.1 EamA family transporter [Psychromonas sp. psych-6C06]
MKTYMYTFLALLAFAGNSILCRYALADGVSDAYSFTTIRLLSGALCLFALIAFQKNNATSVVSGSWMPAVWLFVYAFTFSLAYVSLQTGVGALILFGAVQVTMVMCSLLKGKRLSNFEWLGLIVAFSGLVFLLLPASNTPPVTGFILMVISGIAWGLYSVAGTKSCKPLFMSASNFIKSVPLALLALLFSLEYLNISTTGVFLAVISGSVTSGLGYAIWYVALKGLTVTQASIFQLCVPVLAAFAGILFLNETVTFELLLSSLLVLGGILISIIKPNER